MKWKDLQEKVRLFLEDGYRTLLSQKKMLVGEKYPISPGVYVFMNQKGKIVYAGETTNLKDRMYGHWKRSERSTLRRNVAVQEFGLKNKKKYSNKIEDRITKFILKLTVKYMPLNIGRMELEEYIIGKDMPKATVDKHAG